MSFSDTYGQEVIESRRIRSERARFWAKLVGILLMLLVAVTMRSEPELRTALVGGAVERIMAMRGQGGPETGPALPFPAALPGTGTSKSGSDADRVMELLKRIEPGGIGQTPRTIPPDSLTTAAPHPATGGTESPRDEVKVNRFGSRSDKDQPRFKPARVPVGN